MEIRIRIQGNAKNKGETHFSWCMSHLIKEEYDIQRGEREESLLAYKGPLTAGEETRFYSLFNDTCLPVGPFWPGPTLT